VSDFPTSGDRVIRFIERFLTLGASYLGQPFQTLPFQRDLIRDAYRLNEDGTRKHRIYLAGLPRKNAKSQLGAGLALYHLIADQADNAPQVISAAGDRRQARLVFDEAARMVKMSPALAKACTVYRNKIVCHRTGGTYEAVSADAGLQQGLNPSFVVVDEYHVHKTTDLFDALTLGSATRAQPMFLVISTAGYDLESPLGRLYQHGRMVQSGEKDDPSFGMTWYGPPEGDFDPSDEAIWEMANPAWHHFLNQQEMRAAFRTTHEAAFIRYRLNGWTSAESAWLPHGAWEAVLREDRHLMPGEPVVLGFDGAWKGDSTALVACSLVDFHLEVLGHWEAPPGDPHWRTPIQDVKATIRDAARRYTVRELAADPYRFEESLMGLAEEGLPVVEFPTNSIARMVPATQTFYDSVRDRTLSHDGNPALARHVDNAVLKEDSRGARITKGTASRKIDLAVAAVLAHYRARFWREDIAPEPRLILL
jgi:phage terminase large subunit-like protein